MLPNGRWMSHRSWLEERQSRVPEPTWGRGETDAPDLEWEELVDEVHNLRADFTNYVRNNRPMQALARLDADTKAGKFAPTKPLQKPIQAPAFVPLDTGVERA